ncbi:MAG: heavy-metal-associated domain-containing protein [Chloroflexi bacterium]|nr:heavy-metal-associated domain-containing protein [Chloroflexota bacterium]
MDALALGTGQVTERFAVRGMTCGSCVQHVEAAIAGVPGVRSVRVDLASATATVGRDPTASIAAALHQAVAEAGYALDTPAAPERAAPPRLALRPLALGLLGVLGLLAFYLGAITLAQGWAHALQQLAEDRWFVGAIVAGFGTQVGLFSYLRGLHAQTTAGGVAASTGTSTAAMLACCAHHLTEVFAVIGLSGAAVFLNVYKTPLLWLGILMNLVGVLYLLWQIRQQRTMACEVHHHSTASQLS